MLRRLGRLDELLLEPTKLVESMRELEDLLFREHLDRPLLLDRVCERDLALAGDFFLAIP